MGRFENKAVVITAAASGIGLAAAGRFAAEGARLALCDIDGEALAARAHDFDIDPERLLLATVDVREKTDIEAFVTDAASRFGCIDVLVNNAGAGRRGRVQDLSDEDWRHVMGVSLDSVFIASRAAMPHLVARRGAIVNVASISGLAGDGGNAAYNAAKAAVVNLTRAMAVDAGRDGVRANAVAPGLTATPMTERMRAAPKVMEQYEDRIPLARAGAPEEIAAAICFLASDDASYINGVCLPVDGGLSAWTGQPVWRPRRG
ncbi:MAG TPA: SDR family NAD(P)-dependent oxidoreductase [Beijerinckiaceae bacterium]|nr:SDR family oxidoreductase [Rhodoblastus sp.]MCC0001441.1 SDR family oxidoreductase [Methylobacteriaceae bacterium]MCC2107145.1 SDR family oxidoreductase [Hyphomicrobiales bacterium]HRY02891.1 SDR family NAD(P)-dependent oxidoreductase [Beijerinckiaceae bacterium]MCC0002405.1 SDR family oxidoreductase [Methylobacteriaceae bacterium]